MLRNVRMKIVLLMAKFESLIVVKGKIQVEFDIDLIRNAFQHFCEMSIIVNGQQSERLSNIIEEQIDEAETTASRTV